MSTDDPTPTVTPPPAGVLRPIPCCVVRARRPTPALTAHLRAAAIWAALLRAPDPAEQTPGAAADPGAREEPLQQG
jgi:hypothetical protein